MNKSVGNQYVARRTFSPFNEDISPNDIDIQVNEPKDALNSQIWEVELSNSQQPMLRKNIRVAILKIAKAFNDYLKLDAPLKDVVFTGSLANYNWTLSSDVDIHLILDLDSLSESQDFLQEYIAVKKSLWNENHNITIKNFKVELYAKNEETKLSSKGIYSVVKNKWIQEPIKHTKDIDEIAVKEKASVIMNDIDNLQQIKDDDEIIEKSEKIKERIRKLRLSGLEGGGEYSVENLAFKVLRKGGYLQKLSDIKKNAFDTSLTLTEKEKNMIKEGKEKFKKEYGCLMLDLNIKNWNKVTDKVRTGDVYDVPGFGIEEKPHITVLFGFIYTEVTPEEIKRETKKFLKGKNKVKVRLNELSLFENPDFDVLKFGINSPDLVKLNKVLREKFPYKNDHPDYEPHMTVAYLKPGLGKKYIKKLKKNIVFESGSFSYSYPPEERYNFNLNKEDNTLGVEKGIEGMTPQKVDIIKNFINFVCNRLELEEPVEIYLHKGRDEYIATTASYVPDENSNHIRCTGRSLVDILRSIAHELTHNRQREIESFDVGEVVQTIGGWIEDEANAKAGVMIKDFAMNFGFDEIYDL